MSVAAPTASFPMRVSSASGTSLQLACDTGGTFTDLVVEGLDGGLRFYKRPTTPDDPVRGLLDVIGAAARDLGSGVEELLARTAPLHLRHDAGDERHRHGHDRAHGAARHRGASRHPRAPRGRRPATPFDYTQAYPEPYVPRSLTFEMPERIDARRERRARPRRGGRRARDRRAASAAASRRSPSACSGRSSTRRTSVRVGELLDEHLPGVPFTLVAPHSTRRSASTAAPPRRSIDASLKPLMTRFFQRPRAAAARRRLRRPAADPDLGGRRARRGRGGRERRSTRSAPARPRRRSPAGTSRVSTRAARSRSSPTPAARPTTSA